MPSRWNARRSWRDGRIKQAVIRNVLDLRSAEGAGGFRSRRLHAVAVKGALQDQIVAFARTHEGGRC